MRTGSIEETTEANRVAAASVRPGPIRTPVRVGPRPAAPSESRFTAALVELGRLFTAQEPAPSAHPVGAVRLARAAALLAEATGAEHVAIYRRADGSPTDPSSAAVRLAESPSLEVLAFELAASAVGRDLVPGLAAALASASAPARLELSPAHAAGRRLLAGLPARVVRPLGMQRASAATRLAPVPGWSRVGSMLQIPCPGGAGLNAVVCFDGILFETAGSEVAPTAKARAEAAVALVAAGLERERLASEVDGLRAERARSERLALLGRAAGGAAHDLNNVLTAILGYADLLELELPGVEGRLADAGARPVARGQVELDEIRTAVARGATLVEELLALGRPRADVTHEIDVAEVLERLAGMVRRVAGGAIGVELRLERGLAPVRMGREALERTVLNLIANARHAIEARAGGAGRIGIALQSVRDAGPASSEVASGWLRLTVADDGCGMTSDVSSRIFEPFFTTRAESGGTGLGLAGVADLVRAAGGRIAVDSAPGQGTQVHIELPTTKTLPRA